KPSLLMTAVRLNDDVLEVAARVLHDGEGKNLGRLGQSWSVCRNAGLMVAPSLTDHAVDHGEGWSPRIVMQEALLKNFASLQGKKIAAYRVGREVVRTYCGRELVLGEPRAFRKVGKVPDEFLGVIVVETSVGL